MASRFIFVKNRLLPQIIQNRTLNNYITYSQHSTDLEDLIANKTNSHLQLIYFFIILFETMPNIDYCNHPELLEQCLPWSSTLPDSCKLNVLRKK